MKTIESRICSLLLVAVIAGMAIEVTAQTGSSSAGQEKTFAGIVSDSMCGAKHMAKDKSAADCTRECVKMGSDYALVMGDTVLTLKGDAPAIDKFAGQKATVKGKQNGNTITVESISEAKAQ